MNAPRPLPIAFIDDDQDLREANEQTLLLAGFRPVLFESALEALEVLDESFEGVVVTDLRMPEIDGMELFRRLRARDADLPVILITGHGDIATAVEAMREGAYDFLAKPFASDRLIQSVRRAAEKRRLVMENRRLRLAAEAAQTASPLMGEAPVMQRLRETLKAIADADVDVLVIGETGAGKELVADQLHRLGRRRDGHFVALNCGALPDTVLESELFGHESGAFTGALKKRVGLIEHSNGGTLFLDEIESMSLGAQTRLLRVLEQREVTPLGSNKARPVDLRVVAAAKSDLGDPQHRLTFREDLFHRLNVVTLRIPPLRERRGDVPLLFTFFLGQACRRFQREMPALSDAIHRHLATHEWPGNVRELMHFAERVALGLADLDAPPPPTREDATLPERLELYEAELIRNALTQHKGDVRATLQALGIPRKTFYDKLQRYGINRASFEVPGSADIPTTLK
ncbi:C4-dicarboxylate transport transcriptional regulatory protein DctD [Labrys miyagiensis]|uniref:C4-dicarboxylate transport transcriptional regulatory protein DctD n=1 Tax=Labrys miyagiensis TaxID=346912 RepID=A0ABQ6CYS3_9HYPH|nr:sigma-54 dependent transcriptional regulator [Labrys miyagiensis]GLS23849.1 C4-dicarboxylate transport transcriptional regulatory protein DctD [Labrys miyagiensis]